MFDIREENTFKVYKVGSAVALVLRASFPKMIGEGDGVGRFNDFYSRLGSECIQAAAELAEHVPLVRRGGVYLSLFVRYRLEEEGEVIKITRIYELKQGREILFSKTVHDLFSCELYLVKKRKNMKKQRNIPSRNIENITFESKNNAKKS